MLYDVPFYSVLAPYRQRVNLYQSIQETLAGRKDQYTFLSLLSAVFIHKYHKLYVANNKLTASTLIIRSYICMLHGEVSLNNSFKYLNNKQSGRVG